MREDGVRVRVGIGVPVVVHLAKREFRGAGGPARGIASQSASTLLIVHAPSGYILV
ncbi:MAG TPA: hypothetical protein PKW51_05395 [Methanoregulaceae archaeon]|nr:hypothetical protein [Methanoregulaceae archaeon]